MHWLHLSFVYIKSGLATSAETAPSVWLAPRVPNCSDSTSGPQGTYTVYMPIRTMRSLLLVASLTALFVAYRWSSSQPHLDLNRIFASFSTHAASVPAPSPTSDAPTLCTDPPRDNCSFYASCLETRYHCGPSGYPIGYGQKYCQKFSDERSLLSSKGQTWMIDTMHCLQEALVPDVTRSATETCEELSDKAFGTHARCYLSSGLCDLPPEDWAAIVEIVDFKTLFQSWDAFKASVEAASGCLQFYLFLIKHFLL